MTYEFSLIICYTIQVQPWQLLPQLWDLIVPATESEKNLISLHLLKIAI